MVVLLQCSPTPTNHPWILYVQSTFKYQHYFVNMENHLRHTIWNGNRKYVSFCVLLAISMVFNVPVLYTKLHGCDIHTVLGNKTTMYIFVLGSLQTTLLVLTLVIYFITKPTSYDQTGNIKINTNTIFAEGNECWSQWK